METSEGESFCSEGTTRKKKRVKLLMQSFFCGNVSLQNSEVYEDAKSKKYFGLKKITETLDQTQLTLKLHNTGKIVK